MGTRMLLVCWCVALVGASCGAPSLDGESVTPDEARTTTTVAVTTTTVVPGTAAPTSTTSMSPTTDAPGTSDPTPSDGAPSWFRFGDDGLWLVADDVESLLAPEPVSWAAADYLGGVVFRYGWQVDRPGVYRLMAGSTDPQLVSSHWALPILFDGRASLAILEAPSGDDGYGIDRVELVDLVSGERVVVEGSFGSAGQDGGGVPSNAGGHLLVGIQWIAVGSCGTDTAVVLWSIDERGPIDDPHNPFPSMCHLEDEAYVCDPAGLGARLSPDGSLLAVLHAPVAKWPFPDLDEVGDEEWMATVAGTAVALSVIDLGTGTNVWTGSTPFPATLADFDGRYLVLHTQAPTARVELSPAPISVIVDTVGDHGREEVRGWIVLDREAEVWADEPPGG